MDKSSGINQMFPAESSLFGVKPFMQKIHREIQRIDATILATSDLGTNDIEDLADAARSTVEQLSHHIHSGILRIDATILAAIRQQRNSGTKAKEDLADATHAAEELSHNIQEINFKAEKSEAMVQEICGDINKLDFAKKNITTVITPLHRLSMIVSAVVQLHGMASKRSYREAAAQLEAVNQLCNHFEANWDVPNITYAREKLENIKKILKSHVFSDFSSLGTGKETENTNLLKKLSDSCLVVDALEPSVREELVNDFCSRELISFEQIFVGAELTKLDEIYNQINCRIRTNQEIWKTFPVSWHVPDRLCIQFCKTTREQVESILLNMKKKPVVARLLLELEMTLNFEKELEKKFGGCFPAKRIRESIEEIGNGENSSQNASDIRMKYEKRFAANEELEANERTRNKDLFDPEARFNFRGIISSCFEPHLTPYIEEEEKELMLCLEKVVQAETWDIKEEILDNILSSSIELFFAIKNSYDKCKALTKNQALFNLFKVFQRVLKAYATKLIFKLSKTGTRKQIEVSEIDERVICYIVNSAEYCHKTSGDLAEEVSTIIDPNYADAVDMSEVQDEFSSVISKALATLVRGLETKFDTEMAEMTHVSWGSLESVGDHSEYVNGINTILNNSVPVLGKLLTPVYFRFFLEKLASSIGLRFYANIFRCKKISETGAQQMLLDTQAIEMILLKVPSLDRQTAHAASYSEFVNCQMSRAEAVLKVILSPFDSVADTYSVLFPKGTPMKFQRILELKGLTRADQQSVLDDFNKHAPRFTPMMHGDGNLKLVPVPGTSPSRKRDWYCTGTSPRRLGKTGTATKRRVRLGRGTGTFRVRLVKKIGVP